MSISCLCCDCFSINNCLFLIWNRQTAMRISIYHHCFERQWKFTGYLSCAFRLISIAFRLVSIAFRFHQGECLRFVVFTYRSNNQFAAGLLPTSRKSSTPPEPTGQCKVSCIYLYNFLASWWIYMFKNALLCSYEHDSKKKPESSAIQTYRVSISILNFCLYNSLHMCIAMN